MTRITLLVIPVFKNQFSDTTLVLNEIVHFERWCKDKKMFINSSKTKVLNINFCNNPLPVLPNFENVKVLKMLGVFFNDQLTWSEHFDFILRKASQRLYILRILKRAGNFSHAQLVLVFYALIQSLFDYASPLFLNAHVTLDSRLILICKRAFRIIHGHHARSCDECDLISVTERRRYFASKLFNHALSSVSHVLHNILPHFSHRSRRLILPHVRTSRRLDSFVVACSLLFNRSL